MCHVGGGPPTECQTQAGVGSDDKSALVDGAAVTSGGRSEVRLPNRVLGCEKRVRTYFCKQLPSFLVIKCVFFLSQDTFPKTLSCLTRSFSEQNDCYLENFVSVHFPSQVQTDTVPPCPFPGTHHPTDRGFVSHDPGSRGRRTWCFGTREGRDERERYVGIRDSRRPRERPA